jgi:short-subunit dehydrogenase
MTQTFSSALVTGASSGIGEQIARVLADRGCTLTLVARRADRLAALADELRPKVDVDVVAADLGTDDGVAEIELRLAQRPVQLLVNNAGIGTAGTFHELPRAGEEAEVRLNVLALLRLTHAALQPMVASGRGAVLNIGSLAGDQPLRGSATYAATKSFVTTFTESIAAELKGTGVTATVVKPGFTYTEINQEGAPDPSSLVGRMWMQADFVARESVAAAEKGQLICVPGAQWKALNGVVQTLPRAFTRAVTSRMPGI